MFTLHFESGARHLSKACLMKFDVIAAPGATEYLESGDDPCFGKGFAKTAAACIECRAPVLIDGKVRLMRELCAAKCKGVESPMDLHHLTSRDVAQRLERGEPIAAIFRSILGDVPPDIGATSARQVLVDRLLYLKTTGFPVPVVPRAKDLLDGSSK